MSAFTAVTECPYCKTAFLVALNQLNQANGKVRCGSCLGIFHAHKSMIVEQKNLFSMDGEVLNAAAVAKPVESEKDIAKLMAKETSAKSIEPTLTQRDLNQEDDIRDEFNELMSNSQPLTQPQESIDRYFGEPEEPIDENNVDPGAMAKERHEDMFANDPIVKRQQAYSATAAAMNSSASNRYFITGIVVAGILLLLQIVWLFSPYPGTQYSRLYCMVNSCEVDSDISKYFQVSGEVRRSVESDDILIAKVQLHNRDVTQAHKLPNIIISFEDADGNLQAGREFTPQTYLRSNQQQLQKINANQKISFELNFLHPGRNIKKSRFSVSAN